MCLGSRKGEREMRIVIDEKTVEIIDEIRDYCKDCPNPCSTPYKKRADVIKSALYKFVSMDCVSEEREE